MAWGIIMTAVTLVGMLGLVIASLNQQGHGAIKESVKASALAVEQKRLAA